MPGIEPSIGERQVCCAVSSPPFLHFCLFGKVGSKSVCEGQRDEGRGLRNNLKASLETFLLQKLFAEIETWKDRSKKMNLDHLGLLVF